MPSNASEQDNISDAVIDAIWETIDKLARNGDWDIIDEALEQIDVRSVNIDVLLSFLTATACMTGTLEKRSTLLAKARTYYSHVTDVRLFDDLD